MRRDPARQRHGENKSADPGNRDDGTGYVEVDPMKNLQRMGRQKDEHLLADKAAGLTEETQLAGRGG